MTANLKDSAMRPLVREFLRIGFVSWIPAIIAVAGALTSSSGSSSGGGGSSATYVPTGQGTADTDWQQMMSRLMGTAGGQADTLTPFLNNAFGDTSALYRMLQGRMGTYGEALGGAGHTMLDRANGMYAAGGELWNTALDPEGKLHDRTQQQITDASRAASSARGIGMGGEAAGLENQALSNFQLDWNDRQLGREAEGMKGLTGAYDAAGRQNLGGMSMLDNSAAMFKGAGALPFDLSDMFSRSMGAGVYDPMRNLMANLQAYMGLGQSATGQSFGQNQTNLSNLGNAAGTIFNSPGWGSIVNAFTPSSTGSGGSSTVDDTGWGGA